MMEHGLRLNHRRSPIDTSTVGGRRPPSSDVDVAADGQDLTECWSELLSRLPNDVYAALKAAMGDDE